MIATGPRLVSVESSGPVAPVGPDRLGAWHG